MNVPNSQSICITCFPIIESIHKVAIVSYISFIGFNILINISYKVYIYNIAGRRLCSVGTIFTDALASLFPLFCYYLHTAKSHKQNTITQISQQWRNIRNLQTMAFSLKILRYCQHSILIY